MNIEYSFKEERIDGIGFNSFLDSENVREIIRSQYFRGEWTKLNTYTYHKIKKGWFNTLYEQFLHIDQYNKTIHMLGHCRLSGMIIQFLKRLNIVNDDYIVKFDQECGFLRYEHEL
jgi:hypothetical protein